MYIDSDKQAFYEILILIYLDFWTKLFEDLELKIWKEDIKYIKIASALMQLTRPKIMTYS